MAVEGRPDDHVQRAGSVRASALLPQARGPALHRPRGACGDLQRRIEGKREALAVRLSAVKQSCQLSALDDPGHSVLVSNPMTSRCCDENSSHSKLLAVDPRHSLPRAQKLNTEAKFQRAGSL